jgi:lambda family phage portal protein
MALFSNPFRRRSAPHKGASPGSKPTTRSTFARNLQDPLLFAWNPALREPLDEYRAAWIEITSRTIDALQNSGWLAGGVEQATAAICGPFMALNARPDPAAFGGSEADAATWARQVERRFEIWARNPYSCDFAGQMNLGQLCAQSVKWWFALGEITGIVRYKLRPGNAHGTKIQIIPPQRIPQAAVYQDEKSTQGVILDNDGTPRAYIIQNHNPNEPGVIEEEVVRARDRYGRLVVIHVHDSPPTIVRGLSPLAPAIQVVRQYDQLANATLSAALIQAIFAATIESDAPTEQLLAALQGDEEQATPMPGTAQLPPEMGDFNRFMMSRAEWYQHTKFDLGKMGKVLHIFPGEKLNFLRSEHPNDNYKPFSKTLLLEIARCLGITYEQLTGDREGATYSSERMGSAEIWLINQYRRIHIAGRLMQIAYESWLEEDIELGNTRVPNGIDGFYDNRDAFCRADWRGPAKPTADEFKTARSNQIKLANSIITREMWCADEGMDWQDVDDQIKRERDNAKALGIETQPLPNVPAGGRSSRGGRGGDGGSENGYEPSNAALDKKIDEVLDNQVADGEGR